jgi:hypothetical protein
MQIHYTRELTAREEVQEGNWQRKEPKREGDREVD